jgi:hypothetical protein
MDRERPEGVLLPGDIVLTTGGGWISKLIRKFTRTKGEGKTRYNHVGIVVKPGTIDTAIIVEALHRVRRHTIASNYGKPGAGWVAVWGPPKIWTERTVAKVVKDAESYTGKKYGYLKIGLHALDYYLGKILRKEVFLFRRIGFMDRYPICSWLVAHAYDTIGYRFQGKHPDVVQPDDIGDHVRHPQTGWYVVRPLAPVKSETWM